MRVSPLSGIRFPYVIATNKGCQTVYHQDLAMITSISTDLKRANRPGDQRILQHMHIRGEVFKLIWHHKIREGIKNNINLYPPLCRLDQLLLKLLPDNIIFPDKCFKENALFSILDRIQHH